MASRKQVAPRERFGLALTKQVRPQSFATFSSISIDFWLDSGIVRTTFTGVDTMAGYTKLFRTIWDGSLYGHYPTSGVFMVMLSLADRDGVVDMTPEAIAGTTGWPLEVIRSGIHELMQPDPRSRTPDHEGRRLLLLDESRDWGWRITTYGIHRDRMRSIERREYLRIAQRKHRANVNSRKHVNHYKPIAEAEAEAEVDVVNLVGILDNKHVVKEKLLLRREEILTATQAEFDLPLNDGSFYPITEGDLTKYASLYPAVDVHQEIRSMIGWLDADPKRRKTRLGVRRFINSWLSRSQDRARTNPNGGESYDERRTRKNLEALGFQRKADPREPVHMGRAVPDGGQS